MSILCEVEITFDMLLHIHFGRILTKLPIEFEMIRHQRGEGIMQFYYHCPRLCVRVLFLTLANPVLSSYESRRDKFDEKDYGTK